MGKQEALAEGIWHLRQSVICAVRALELLDIALRDKPGVQFVIQKQQAREHLAEAEKWLSIYHKSQKQPSLFRKLRVAVHPFLKLW